MSQPPQWPQRSIAALTHTQSPSKSKIIDDFFRTLLTTALHEDPSGPVEGIQWITSELKAARAPASQTYQDTQKDFAIEKPDFNTAFQQFLSCIQGLRTHDTHGGYMAYAPTGALLESALAAFGSAVINPGLTWMPTAPKFAAMERCVIDWVLRDVLHWPPALHSGGVFTSGGSTANTLGLHVARESLIRQTGCKHSDLRFFVAEQVHYCIWKGLRILGVEPHQLIKIPHEKDGRLSTSALQEILINQRHSLKGGIIIGIGGETSTGFVDPLDALADLCEAYPHLWLHIDACLGGFFALTQRGRQTFKSIERVNSIALDPHKALQMPYGVGMLMIRHETDLQQAFTARGPYTPPQSTEFEEKDIVDIADLGLELSREARGAQVWLPLRAYGPTAFVEHLDWCQDAIHWIASVIQNSHLLEIVTQPQLSILTFRLRQQYELISPKELAEWFVDEINSKGRIMLAPTVSGTPCMRICILSARTQPKHLSQLAEDILATATTLTQLAQKLTITRALPLRSSGFQIRYTVRPIPGKTLGLVTTQDIPQDTLVIEQPLLTGDFQFLHRSTHPNLSSKDQQSWLANRLIFAGEELLISEKS